MKKLGILTILLIPCLLDAATPRDLKVEGKRLISRKPPFTVALPYEFQFVHSASVEHKEESSLTRTFLFVKAKEKQAEAILILQIADKTNPQAGPMTIPPLKPLAEKRLLSKGRLHKGEIPFDYLFQSMAWNPDAASLRPVLEKGMTIPSRWTLQGQCLFPYFVEHAVFIRYSREVNSFGFEVSQEGKRWEKGSISGNEKRAYEIFQKTFMEMIDSIVID